MKHFILLLIAIIFSNHSYAAEFSKFRVVIFSKSSSYDDELGNIRFKKMIVNRIDDLSGENFTTDEKRETILNIVRFMINNHYKFLEEVIFPGFTLYQPIHSKSDFYRLVEAEVKIVANSIATPIDQIMEEEESCIESESIESFEINEALLNTSFTDIDVLFGRGPNINNHPGNKNFRRIVGKHREKYSNAKTPEKQNLATDIMSTD